MAENTKVEVGMSEQEKAWVNGGAKAPAAEVPAKETPATLPKMETIPEGETVPEGKESEETTETTTQPETKEEPEMQTIDIEAQVKPIKDNLSRLETHASRLVKIAEVYKKQAEAGDQSAAQSYNDIVREYNEITKEYEETNKMAVGIQEKGRAVNMLTEVFNNTPKEFKAQYKAAYEKAIKMTPFTSNADNFVDNVLKQANRLLDARGLKHIEAPEEPAEETNPPAKPDDTNAKKIIKKVGTAAGKTTGNAEVVDDVKSLKERTANGDKEAQRKLFSRGDPFFQKLKASHR